MTSPLTVMILLPVLITQIHFFQTVALLDINLIENYFTEKSIKSATVFGCFPKNEQVNLVKILSKGSSPISVLNLNNQTEVHKSINTNHQQIGVVLDGDCPESESFLITCGQLKLFDVKHHWLIISKSVHILDKIKNAIININADIHVAVQSGSNWTIFDVYNPASKHGGTLKYPQMGFYSHGRGYNARTNEAKYWRRKNMTGVTFKTMVVLLVPFKGSLEDYLYNDDNRNINTFNRMIVELGTSWGYPLPNGSFDGMVGALGKKLIDFGSSPIFIREDRARFIDYGRNTWSWKLSRISIPKPKIEDFNRDFSETSLNLNLVDHRGSGNRFYYNFENGSPTVPKMACGRITAISIFLLSVIIYQFYSASIVSHLLMKPTSKIKNLKDLTESTLKHTTDKVLKELYFKKIYGKGNMSHFFPPEKGVDLVRQGGYAFHIEVARAYPIIETTFPDYAISRTCPTSVFDINRQNIQERMKSRHFHTGIILYGDCASTEKFITNCGQSYLFDVKHHWLIIASSKNIRAKFDNVILNINADIKVVIPEKTSNWSVIDVYNPASKHGGALNFTKIGIYNKHDGYKIKYTGVKYWNRKNLTGVTFKSMVVLPVPFKGTLQNYLDSDDNRDVNTFNRFHSRLISFCKDYYNFSLDIEVSRSWGYTKGDGTFDGMVGALENKIIDFGSSPLFLREDRARVIDYGRNTWILRAAFIFRNPKARTNLEIFLRPLPSSVWLITGLLAIVSIIILKLATSFERRRYVHAVETSWSVSVIFTLGAFCQQGSPSTPKMACGRIAVFFIFLLSVLIYQFYSASLVSHLLNKPLTKIKTLRDLLESPLKAGCEDILYDRDYFMHTNDEVARELYTKKILGKSNSSNFHTPEEGLRLVEEGGYAFHVETATAYPIIESTFQDQAVCELREVQLFRTQPMHANFQKKSPFRDMFDTCFQRLAEHGLLVREREHWHPRKPECIQSSKSIQFNMGLDDFYPALVILLVGIATSLVILIIEKEFTILKEKPAHPPIMVLEAKNTPYPYVD
ncbi:uncharacterized protein LOC123011804 [Tribolium madens]|uniref:uncharacterized protein LOC123011804 n=1 Tax=Tribolium madens TaxID=41895 RepID=UPI001CF763DF|nr:uncharacterized protein LOC123011804 [Tribolium madens]